MTMLGLPLTSAPRVVLVEDDRNMALMLTYNLEAFGYAVATIGEGSTAVDAIAGLEPDLVVLDWHLPGLSGIEVLRQLRLRLHCRRIPIVMVTGRNGADDRARALAAGADVFLAKPFPLATLMQSVTVLLPRPAPPEVAPSRHRA